MNFQIDPAADAETVLEKLQAGKTLIVRLKSYYLDQYLYAEADQFNKNDQLRTVFTCRSYRDPKEGNWASWKMTRNYTPFGNMSVRLASVEYNNELLVNKLGIDSYVTSSGERRYVYTLRDETILSPENENAMVDWYMVADPSGVPNRYYFRSYFIDELLYVPNPSFAIDSERLHVLTWVSQGGIADFSSDFAQLLWDIEIVSEEE